MGEPRKESASSAVLVTVIIASMMVSFPSTPAFLSGGRLIQIDLLVFGRRSITRCGWSRDTSVNKARYHGDALAATRNVKVL